MLSVVLFGSVCGDCTLNVLVFAMQADAKKIKVRKTNIPVTELVYGGMPPNELQKAIEKEFEMALQDRVMEETKDKKNAVEAYVYNMRSKVVCLYVRDAFSFLFYHIFLLNFSFVLPAQ